ncbi:2863_t:CDS:2 [Dentiscutata erythropus]|uniref:2863_t:CDS:1 n=1 Tax=Dentiscutata erythropus TaxID=1348616 RepID=A0A9N9IYF7_9GLOM|nr:2863_t:CDS:2 [Dentiscutata erythropus]
MWIKEAIIMLFTIVSRKLNFSEPFCRRNFTSRPEKKCENQVIHEFLQEIQLNSKYCNNFIDWVPNSDVNYIKSHNRTENSEIFLGIWKPFKIHHQCLGKCAIPFYGLTLYPETRDYAMIMKRAVHGDLCKYVHTHKYKLSWTKRIKILVNIAKALEYLHSQDLVHHDLHCKNILVDEDDKIFICDFGLSHNSNSQSELLQRFSDMHIQENIEIVQRFSDMHMQENVEIVQSFRSNDEQDTSNVISVADNNQTRQYAIDLCDSDRHEQESIQNNEYTVWQSLELLLDDFFHSMPTRSFLVEHLLRSTFFALSGDTSDIYDQVSSLLDLFNHFGATDEIPNLDVQNEEF